MFTHLFCLHNRFGEFEKKIDIPNAVPLQSLRELPVEKNLGDFRLPPTSDPTRFRLKQCRRGSFLYDGEDSTIGASLHIYGEWDEQLLSVLDSVRLLHYMLGLLRSLFRLVIL